MPSAGAAIARAERAHSPREATTHRTPTPRRCAPGRAQRDQADGVRESSDFSFYAHGKCGACAPRGRYFEIASSAMPLVRGPISPITAITTAIAPAMNTNTPAVPKPFSTAAIANDVKIAEKRLHE